jgi:hypothetical protein
MKKTSNDLLPNIGNAQRNNRTMYKALSRSLVKAHMSIRSGSPDWVGLRPARIGDVRCELGAKTGYHTQLRTRRLWSLSPMGLCLESGRFGMVKVDEVIRDHGLLDEVS